MVTCRDCKFGSWALGDTNHGETWGKCRFRMPRPIQAYLNVEIDLNVRCTDTCDLAAEED